MATDNDIAEAVAEKVVQVRRAGEVLCVVLCSPEGQTIHWACPAEQADTEAVAATVRAIVADAVRAGIRQAAGASGGG